MGTLDKAVSTEALETYDTDGSNRLGLVAHPLSPNGISSGGAGSGAVAFSNSDASRIGLSDDAGLARSVRLTTTASALPNGACFYDNVYGSHIGPRWYGDNLAGVAAFPFDFEVDGEVIGIDDVLPRRHNVPTVNAMVNTARLFPLHIGAGRHTVAIYLQGDPSLAKSMYFTGWTTSGNGMSPTTKAPVGGFTAAVACTTAATAISYAGVVAGLHFSNTDTTAHTVTVLDPNGATYAVLAVAANGGVADLTFPTLRTISGWKVKVDTTPGSGAVNYWTNAQ